VETLREWIYLDERPLAATIFYFPPAKMDGDVDNIVKLILDGMKNVIYLEDNLIERVTVQKFEPDITWTFRSLTSKLEEAVESEPPVIYIRIDDDLSWRDVA
jgi:crossover junction endodeoxyribonuclease RusA